MTTDLVALLRKASEVIRCEATSKDAELLRADIDRALLPYRVFQDDPSMPEGVCLCPHCGAVRTKEPCMLMNPAACKFHATTGVS